MSFYVSEFGTPSPWFFPYFAPFLMAIRTNVAMVAHSLARSPRGPRPGPGPVGPASCAMADVAGAGKYHSFSGINTDKTVMDNLEAPCLGSDESTKMPNRCQTHLFNYQSIYIYIYIIHCNPTYHYIYIYIYIYILHYPLGIFLRRGVRKMGAPLAQHCFPHSKWLEEFGSPILSRPLRQFSLHLGKTGVFLDDQGSLIETPRKLKNFLNFGLWCNRMNLMCFFLKVGIGGKLGDFLLNPYFFQPSNICPRARAQARGKDASKRAGMGRARSPWKGICGWAGPTVGILYFVDWCAVGTPWQSLTFSYSLPFIILLYEPYNPIYIYNMFPYFHI